MCTPYVWRRTDARWRWEPGRCTNGPGVNEGFLVGIEKQGGGERVRVEQPTSLTGDGVRVRYVR